MILGKKEKRRRKKWDVTHGGRGGKRIKGIEEEKCLVGHRCLKKKKKKKIVLIHEEYSNQDSFSIKNKKWKRIKKRKEWSVAHVGGGREKEGKNGSL